MPAAAAAKTSTARIAVVGAGWAGLACAVELAAAGCAPTLFEAGRKAGGRARGIDLAGQRLDNGQHLLLGAYRETLRLLERIGSSQRLQRQTLTLAAPAQGFHLTLPRLPAPLHLAAGLLAARGVSWGEKLAAVRFMRRLQASHYRLDHDCSVAELLDRHQQHGALRQLLWQPLCLAALNTAPEQASAQVFANVLRDSLGGQRAATDMLLPNCDLGQLYAEPALAYLAAHGGHWRPATRIKQLERKGSGWRLADQDFEQVVVAVAPQHANALLADLPELAEIHTALAGYRYEPIATIYLGYPPATRLAAPMLMLPGPHGQFVFDRGQGVLACVISASGPWQELSEEALAAALHLELQQAAGQLARPLWQRTVCERRATYACTPNLARPANRTALPGLWLAGDYTAGDYPATLEGAVQSGVLAAQQLLDSLAKR